MEMMTKEAMINSMCADAHNIAVAHGFYDEHNACMAALETAGAGMQICEAAERDFVLAQIAKIDSECGEAVHAIQHGEQPERITEELADVIIRVLDLCGHMSADLGGILMRKMEKNHKRPYKHGKRC